jgi:hypothetical protein
MPHKDSRKHTGWGLLNKFPIASIDDERMPVSGGLPFAANTREEVFEWLLKNLDEILQTIFGDEYSVIIGAMAAHSLCVLHKRLGLMDTCGAQGTPSDA